VLFWLAIRFWEIWMARLRFRLIFCLFKKIVIVSLQKSKFTEYEIAQLWIAFKVRCLTFKISFHEWNISLFNFRLIFLEVKWTKLNSPNSSKEFFPGFF
jgi:hypothetical protein